MMTNECLFLSSIEFFGTIFCLYFMNIYIKIKNNIKIKMLKMCSHIFVQMLMLHFVKFFHYSSTT